MRLAELWLDEACAFPAGTSAVKAWSRAEWVEATLPAWRELVDPIAGKVVDSMGTMLAGEGGPMAQLGAMPEQAAAMAGPLQQMMRSIGGAMFGTQIGQAIGALACEVVGSTDVGLPLAPDGTAALLPANVAAFGAGLEVPPTRCGSTSRCARLRTTGCSRTCRGCARTCVDAVAAYARGITVDTARLEEAIGTHRPDRPGVAAARAAPAACSSPRTRPSRRPRWPGWRPRSRWSRAGSTRWSTPPPRPQLPGADALRETVRRRRATGGPAEQTFASLVGLELRPRRLRDAAALWRAVLARARPDGREARLGAPRPAADGRRPRRPGGLRPAAAPPRWTCPAWTTPRRPPSPTQPVQRLLHDDPPVPGCSPAWPGGRTPASRTGCGRRTSAPARPRRRAAGSCVPAHLTASAMVLDHDRRRGCC